MGAGGPPVVVLVAHPGVRDAGQGLPPADALLDRDDDGGQRAVPALRPGPSAGMEKPRKMNASEASGTSLPAPSPRQRVLVALVVLGPWMGSQIGAFAERMITIAQTR